MTDLGELMYDAVHGPNQPENLTWRKRDQGTKMKYRRMALEFADRFLAALERDTEFLIVLPDDDSEEAECGEVVTGWKTAPEETLNGYRESLATKSGERL